VELRDICLAFAAFAEIDFLSLREKCQRFRNGIEHSQKIVCRRVLKYRSSLPANDSLFSDAEQSFKLSLAQSEFFANSFDLLRKEESLLLSYQLTRTKLNLFKFIRRQEIFPAFDAGWGNDRESNRPLPNAEITLGGTTLDASATDGARLN